MTSEAAVGDRPRPWAAVLAWALGIVGVGEVLGIVALNATADPAVSMIGFEYIIVVFLITISAYSLVGAAIAARRPRHYAGWTLMAGGIGFGLSLLAISYGQVGLPPASHRPGAEIGIWLGEWLFVLALAGTAILFLLHFPDGHLPGPRWIWVRRATLTVIGLYIVGQAFRPGDVSADYPEVANPFGAPTSVAWIFEAMALGGNLGLALLLAAGALALIQRYRSATITERLQIKWIAYVGAGLAVVLPIAAAQVTPISEFAWAVGLTLVAALPLAVAFAVLRYRLYEIDRLISSTIVYGGLTAILAGLYTASIRLFNGVFVAMTGEESDAALVITTLILATTLTPIRRWLEGLVEGRAGGRSGMADGSIPPPGDPFADPAYVERVTQIVERSVDQAMSRRSGGPKGGDRAAG